MGGALAKAGGPALKFASKMAAKLPGPVGKMASTAIDAIRDPKGFAANFKNCKSGLGSCLKAVGSFAKNKLGLNKDTILNGASMLSKIVPPPARFLAQAAIGVARDPKTALSCVSKGKGCGKLALNVASEIVPGVGKIKDAIDNSRGPDGKISFGKLAGNVASAGVSAVAGKFLGKAGDKLAGAISSKAGKLLGDKLGGAVSKFASDKISDGVSALTDKVRVLP